MAKAMAHQDKQLTRMRQWHGGGPPDDLDLEWEKLLAANGLSEQDHVTEGPEAKEPAGSQAPRVLVRPEFPPPSLGLKPAFPPELGNELGGEVLMVWNFLYGFSDVLGMHTPSLDSLLHALMDVHDKQLLPLIHITLLRLLQADMEEAHAAGAALVSAQEGWVEGWMGRSGVRVGARRRRWEDWVRRRQVLSKRRYPGAIVGRLPPSCIPSFSRLDTCPPPFSLPSLPSALRPRQLPGPGALLLRQHAGGSLGLGLRH
jgi:hypothetical protein